MKSLYFQRSALRILTTTFILLKVMMRAQWSDDSDIVLIQKHILLARKYLIILTSIAADLNNSKSITSADIGELRKLILGIKLPRAVRKNLWRSHRNACSIWRRHQPWSGGWKEDIAVHNLTRKFIRQIISTGIKIDDTISQLTNFIDKSNYPTARIYPSWITRLSSCGWINALYGRWERLFGFNSPEVGWAQDWNCWHVTWHYGL